VERPAVPRASGSSRSSACGAATLAHDPIDVYRALGVRPFINARGTWTYLSGSLQLPEGRRVQLSIETSILRSSLKPIS
jgi:L-seryl-tRNA(Ser) seleniumtransferase